MTEPYLHQVEDGWIETLTGEAFYFGDPQPETVHIADIAGALSKACRYNGHVQHFYSVAEHSVLLTQYVKRHGGSAKDQMTALLHDASEAYLSDVPRPVKVFLPSYKVLEKRIESVICRKFGAHFPYPSWMKDIDTRILRDEREQAMSKSGREWGVDAFEPLGVTLEFWTWEIAQSRFLAEFERINKEMQNGL